MSLREESNQLCYFNCKISFEPDLTYKKVRIQESGSNFKVRATIQIAALYSIVPKYLV